MPPIEGVSLAHFPVRSVDQLTIKIAIGILSRLKTDARRTWHLAKIWDDLTSGRVGFAALGEATRHFLDSGRHTAEALKDTSVEFAAFPVTGSLDYGGYGSPAIAVILEWIELNMLDDEQRVTALPPAHEMAP